MDPFGGEYDDRESGGSRDGSSDNDQEGPVEDRDDEDMDGNGAPEADADGEGENEEDNEDEDDEPDQDDSQYPFGDGPNQGQTKRVHASQTSSTSNTSESLQGQTGVDGLTSAAPTSNPKPSVLLTSPSPTQDSATSNGLSFELPKVRPEALTASVYDIVPTIAAPHSTSINSITATPDLRWVFTGGADGYIRKFNWLETANGKSMLTVAQRHPFVDSVTKAGVLMSYWDNTEEPAGKSSEETSSISSVYSLAVQREGLWLLSGLESGGINLQSVRHDEGKQITCLRGHTSAVSVLNLAPDEKSVLSGSWDKNVIDWDLNTGKVVRNFEGSGGQISALETRPLSSLPVPEASGDMEEINGTFSTDSTDKPRINGTVVNDIDHDAQHEVDVNGNVGSPADSLFGGNDGDSLFGDNDNEAHGAPSGGNFVDDDDDEFSRAIANGIRDHEHDQEQEKAMKDLEGDTNMKDASQSPITVPVNQNAQVPASPATRIATDHTVNQDASGLAETVKVGLPHSSELLLNGESGEAALANFQEASSSSDSTFLAASFDGSLHIWDKRRNTPIAKITPQNVPPWCMNACWSPDGNFIYAGRRNGTVDEYSLHKGLRGAERSFKLPNNSGPVSAVRAMPNGRHLICASYDILRLYDLQQQQIFKHATVPFLIVPGHRTGVVSHLYMDPTCRYLVSTAGNRGWEGSSTEVLLGYEIGVPKIPERKIIVYTDPADKDFNSPDGKVAFKHRWVQSIDGRMTEHAWVFKEKAIETVFDKLIIAGTQANIENEDDDALIEAMKSSEIDAREKTGKESQVGQIVVELHRVVLGEKRLEAHFRPRLQEGQEEDIDMERAPRDITHATGLIHKKTLKSEPLRVVEHWPYQPNEGPYATFQFFYRSREQLQKFHFPGFVSLPTTTTARTTRLFNTRMADLTPLSISLPLEKKTKKMWCDHDSCEAKIEKRGFRPGGSHKYDFGSEYRDIPAMSPSVGDEACETKISLKYPAAPLPIVANSVESSHLDAFPLKTSAEAPLLAGNLQAPDPEYKLQVQGRARQTSRLDTPTFITAKTSSSAPSLTRFTAEQVTDITDRNRYRPIARDCYPSDREENTEDEHITESDLETHADDDELSYTVGPEDEGYDSLQSQFRDVRIRKRQRDDAEDAEDDNMACQGAPTAHSDGRREQTTLKLPLTEEERAHRGKKSRTAKQTLVADGGQDAHGTGGVA